MANTSTISIQDTINYCQRLLRQRPLAIGNSLEPATTAANIIKQTILGAPFAWRWNRLVKTLNCTAPSGGVVTQDYSLAVQPFAWIETSSVKDPVDSKWYEMETENCLGLETKTGRPRFIAAQSDDLGGNITFRLMPAPDKAYAVSLTVQQLPARITSLADLWNIPDEFQNIYTWGFLSLMYMFADDPRFQLANQKFVGALLSRAEGLSETKRNIFLNSWQAITGEANSRAMDESQGKQSRGM